MTETRRGRGADQGATPPLSRGRRLPGTRPSQLLPAGLPARLAVLALLTLLTRTPSFVREIWNPDEGYLATQARQLASGGTLYETVVDRKPPLLPWLYQGAFALFGDASLWPLRAAAVLAVFTGAALLASLAARRWGARAGTAAGICYVLSSVALAPEDTQAATFEVFMLPWTVLAMWCADRGRWAGAGVAVAGALLVKQTGGAVLLPVLWLAWSQRAGGTALLRLTAGAVLPVLAAAVAHGPSRFLFWLVTGSGQYVSPDGSVTYALLRALGGAGLLTAGCLPMVLAVLVAVRRRSLRQTADGWIWLAASAAAVTVGFQFFGHYFLQLTPPVALLTAAALHHAPRRAVRTLLAANAALAAGFLAWAFFLFPSAELAHQQRLSAEIRARTAPSDRVLLWGMHPETYWLADRPPASRYLTAGFLTNFSGGRKAARVGEEYAMPGSWPYFRSELRRRPPELIADDSRDKPYGIARTPTLRAYVERHYTRAATVNGTVIWVRSRPAR